ncbi:iron ABC transporter permease [Hwanghaeella grinnelliae]|uniref:Iron ABC transporter permease n=1 Tax=Hwanghaeella grinnelliae TaxID=2500179 RepID=A0A437QHL8_9PROT|nr:iron ABC transporter permease [Hwanghaeella grinnelliae]RVU33924.1 iron ABC transporter permease [Hwanghaeella grinnelliae]
MNDFSFRFFDGRISGRLHRYAPVLAVLFTILLLTLLATSAAMGSFEISLPGLWAALTSPASGQTETTVLWELRLPRFIAACLVGAMLGLSGALLQGVTRNPLADPSLVGVSQGASLAVVALIILFPTTSLFWRPLCAFGGAILASLLIQWISAGRSSAQSLRFILVGIGLAALISSVTTAALTYGQINLAMEALSWLAGSVHTASWKVCQVLIIGFLVLSPLLVWVASPLAVLRFGPEISSALGLNVRRARFTVITLSVALAALAVSVAGPIGFVGLLAPQLVHRLIPSRPGTHLFLTAFVGALIVALADLVGRTAAAPIQLPAGLVSSIIGAPIFAILLLRRVRTSLS